MAKNPTVFAKALLVSGIVIFLTASIVFSVQSFTGYVVTDEVNSGFNLASFALFALGIFCTFVYLKKFKNG